MGMDWQDGGDIKLSIDHKLNNIDYAPPGSQNPDTIVVHTSVRCVSITQGSDHVVLLMPNQGFGEAPRVCSTGFHAPGPSPEMLTRRQPPRW